MLMMMNTNYKINTLYDLNELQSFNKVVDIVAKRFQRRVRPFAPHLWQLANEQAVRESFKV